MKDILFVGNNLSDLGGKSIVVNRLVCELRNKGFVVSVNSEWEEYRILYIRSGSWIVNLFYWIRSRRLLISKLRDIHFTGSLVCCDIESLFLAFGSVSCKRIVFWSHSSFFMLNNRLKLATIKLISSLIKKSVVLNMSELPFLSNSIVIPNFYKDMTKESPKLGPLLNVVAYGRFSWEKNFSDFVRLSVICKDLNVYFYLYGEGPERILLEKLYRELGANGNLTIDHAKSVEDIYSGADLLVVTSLFDCFPTNILEAKSYSVPTLSYDAKTGPKYMITDGLDGYIVQNGDLMAMRDKILLLLNNQSHFRALRLDAKKSLRNYNAIEILEKWKLVLRY